MQSKLLISLFLAMIFGLPLGQAAWELSRGEPVQALEVIGPVEEARLRTFEKNLRETSYVHQKLVPWYQLMLLRVLGRGNEKTIVGNDDWLYFGENLDYVTRPPFGLAGREAILDTIEDFGRQLEDRGIALILVPAPAKVCLQPQHLSRWTRSTGTAESPFTQALFSSVKNALVWPMEWDPPAGPGIECLPRDTHWSPELMQATARGVAARARTLLGQRGVRLEREVRWRTEPLTVRGNGDLTDMLHLPPGIEAYDPMELELERVVNAESGEPFAPDRSAEVLLLGDSFTLVFSDPRLNMGEGAGFAEHLALELGAPLDVIALAGGSARAVREALARRQAGLAGKKLVIWQISIRDFAGDPAKWTRVELPAGEFAGKEPAAPIRVRAEIVEVTRIPAEFEYELCLAVHEYRVLEVLEGNPPPGPLWVAHLVIDDFKPTPQADFQVGQQQILSLDDVSLHYDLEETSWMDTTDSDPRAVIWFPTEIEEAGR